MRCNYFTKCESVRSFAYLKKKNAQPAKPIMWSDLCAEPDILHCIKQSVKNALCFTKKKDDPNRGHRPPGRRHKFRYDIFTPVIYVWPAHTHKLQGAAERYWDICVRIGGWGVGGRNGGLCGPFVLPESNEDEWSVACVPASRFHARANKRRMPQIRSRSPLTARYRQSYLHLCCTCIFMQFIGPIQTRGIHTASAPAHSDRIVIYVWHLAIIALARDLIKFVHTTCARARVRVLPHFSRTKSPPPRVAHPCRQSADI